MDGETVKPLPEGVRFVGPTIDDNGVVQKYLLRLGRAESLSALAAEYAFFTPAILYLHAGFIDAPLIDCIYERREDLKFYFRRFQKPIFRGLHARDGDTDWNHVLWAVERRHWEFFLNFMVSVTLAFSETRDVICVGAQDLRVVDPLAADLQVLFHPALPELDVTAFGVNGNRRRLAMACGPSRLMDPPTLAAYRPAGSAAAFAEAFYDGRNPVNARTNFANRQSIEENRREGKT